MAEIILDYSEIQDSSRAAKKVADQCEDFANDLEKKVTKKLGDLKRGASGNTTSATSYMNAKIKELNKKATSFTNFSKDLDNFLNDDVGAKKTDKKAADEIKSYSKIFLKNNDMSVGPITDFFMMISNTFYNSTEFGQWLKKMNNAWDNFWADKARDIKYWYHCKGGKQALQAGAAIVLTVVAVAACVIAVGAAVAAIGALCSAIAAGAVTAGVIWGAVSATAGAIAAVIGVADAVTNTYFSFKAAMEDDPAWAKRYGDMDSASDALEKVRYKDGFMNNLTSGASKVVKGVEVTCNFINIADMASKGYKFIKNFKNTSALWKNKNKIKFFKEVDGKKTLNKSSIKYTWMNIKKDYGAFKDAFTKNVFEDYAKANYKWVKYADIELKDGNVLNKIFKDKNVYDIMETIEGTTTGFQSDIEEDGVVKAAWDRVKDKTTIIKYFSDIKDTFNDACELCMA